MDLWQVKASWLEMRAVPPEGLASLLMLNVIAPTILPYVCNKATIPLIIFTWCVTYFTKYQGSLLFDLVALVMRVILLDLSLHKDGPHRCVILCNEVSPMKYLYRWGQAIPNMSASQICQHFLKGPSFRLVPLKHVLNSLNPSLWSHYSGDPRPIHVLSAVLLYFSEW